MNQSQLKNLHYALADEQATVRIGTLLAQVVIHQKQGLVVYLYGDLGAGKTTLTRGFVRGMGHQGNVKSPTYTLVEPYDLGSWQIYHFDLYRLSDPEELEFMGIREYFSSNTCSFIEWPEKGAGWLANADISIKIAYHHEQRQIELCANNERGSAILSALEQMQVSSN